MTLTKKVKKRVDPQVSSQTLLLLLLRHLLTPFNEYELYRLETHVIQRMFSNLERFESR